MFKLIRRFFIKLKLKELANEEQELNEERARLVHRPPLEEIPERLDQCEKIGKRLKKIKKKRKKLMEKLGA